MKRLPGSTRRLARITAAGLLIALAVRVVPVGHAEIITDATPVPPVGALGGPHRSLTPDELEQFIRGRKVFDRDWRLSLGLGTDLNGDSCRACHQDPLIGGSGGLDVNVFRFGFDDGGLGPFMDLPGGQIASKVRRPDVFGRENHDPAADVFEQRNSPSLFGLGLIDSIADDVIYANEDPTDSDGDGIFGVARRVEVNGTLECGKFGWKAQLPQLQDFVDDAMGNEIGITSADNGRPFAFLADSDPVVDPELSAPDRADVLFFMTLLASPPRAGSSDPLVVLGEQVFGDIGCATCHIPSLAGAEGPVPLYSDLLLHDVHSPTFRGMAEAGADVGMYRTPPLWGIRHTDPYFHDGRAATLLEAVLIHGGEAESVRQAFEGLASAERDALIRFLEDL